MKKILVIGATGLVGSRFVELASDKFDFIAADENNLDITNKQSVVDFFNNNNFDATLNLAAFTDVGGAENQRDDINGLAWKLNVLAPSYLAEASSKTNRFLVHFSTDFVFEGTEDSKGPFDEDSPLPNDYSNLSWYGWTKLQGEHKVRTWENSAIVRIAYPFRASFGQKADFARKIIDLYDQGNLFPLFSDQTITPIFVDDMVGPLSKIIENQISGNFHLVSSDIVTYYDFGNYLLEKTRNVKDAPKKASLVEFMKSPGKNKRPIWGGLETQKTQEKLGIKFKTWKQMVDSFSDQLSS